MRSLPCKSGICALLAKAPPPWLSLSASSTSKTATRYWLDTNRNFYVDLFKNTGIYRSKKKCSPIILWTRYCLALWNQAYSNENVHSQENKSSAILWLKCPFKDSLSLCSAHVACMTCTSGSEIKKYKFRARWAMDALGWSSFIFLKLLKIKPEIYFVIGSFESWTLKKTKMSSLEIMLQFGLFFST